MKRVKLQFCFIS